MTAFLKNISLLAILISSAFAEETAEELFVRRIAPIFHEKCIACHGGEKKIKGGFDLRSLEAVLEGGDSGDPGIVPGKPEESSIYLSVMREDDFFEPMPEKEVDKLYAEQTGWIRKWIEGGAPWPDEERSNEIAAANAEKWEAEDGVILDVGGLSEAWANRRYKPDALWAYQPVSTPEISGKGNPIDELIEKRMPGGLEPAPAADARTLIRRATFDLTGLPPTPEEVSDFENANSENPDAAMGSLVNRLLESPHYGERMAQHWLDVTRYADSSGFSNDFERGNAWRYRDYVIRAFNDDKPYDQFIREQIAGDEIDPQDPEKLVATGFLRMGPWELTAMEVPRIARQRFLDDVTNSVGETFLAHSLQCARCHDHKFDPIPTRDYYSIQAVFNTTQLAEREARFLEEENTDGFDEKKYLDARLADYSGKGTSLKPTDAKKVEDQAALNKSLGKISSKGKQRLTWEFDRYKPYALSVYNGKNPGGNSVSSPVRIPKDPLKKGSLDESRILTGGDPFANGDPVTPGVLTILATKSTKAIPDKIEGRRLPFAEWVASEENPLTTRSIVNRVWLWHFGDAIAGNPNNFGGTGKRPTHPEILDYLAAELVENASSFKHLHRLIMTSETYRRSSTHPDHAVLLEKDPALESLAVFKPRRLSAEELRDTMLAATGELNPQIGGIPNRPEINLEAALQPRQVMGTFASAWVPNPLPEQRHRRSIYALKLRGLGNPFMETFNSPSPDFSCERRDSSTVTPQVFSLFNGQPVHTRALALAVRVSAETDSEEDAIQRAFALTLSRQATPEEFKACLAHWKEIEAMVPREAHPLPKPPVEVLREAVEEQTGENFTFLETLHANADFVPDIDPTAIPRKTRALADICLVLLNSNEFAYVY